MNKLRRLMAIGSMGLAAFSIGDSFAGHWIVPVRDSLAGHSVAPVATVSTASAAAPTNTAPAKAPPPGAPQVPEPSATIRDDPTIAPDPKQSADNNVSFPSDI